MTAVIDHDFPRPRRISHLVGRFMLKLGRWQIVAMPPPGIGKAVLVAAPHTSNWDFPVTVLAAWAADLKLHWLGKNGLFRWPLGWLLRGLGGVPVERSRATGLVGQLAERYAASERLIIAVPPSGTRSKRPRWKSGFYHIAREAGVHMLCAYVDYTKKQICFGPTFVPTGDVKADMDRIRAFFVGVEGRFPDKQSTIQLAEEETSQTT